MSDGLHCCWPRQAWSTSQELCIGTPACPAGFGASGDTCVESPSCEAGKTLTADGLHCCWPRQAWSTSQELCIGTPVCPVGFEVDGEGCVSQAELEERRAEQERRLGIEWVRIPGGTFQMGSTSGDSNEQLVHAVRVSSFELMKTEVTVGQFRQCMAAGACTPPMDKGRYSYNCKWGHSVRENHPVSCVDWEQAQEFASWAGGRLPTEAEWEYAARSGGQDWTYPWGNEVATCSRAVMDDGGYGCGQERPWPVCSKPAGNSTQGVCDLAGNVAEWVQDTYQNSYMGAPSDGTAWEAGASSRVFRGGSWGGTGSGLRASGRYRSDPSNRNNYLGFRLARSIQTGSALDP